MERGGRGEERGRERERKRERERERRGREEGGMGVPVALFSVGFEKYTTYRSGWRTEKHTLGIKYR